MALGGTRLETRSEAAYSARVIFSKSGAGMIERLGPRSCGYVRLAGGRVLPHDEEKKKTSLPMA